MPARTYLLAVRVNQVGVGTVHGNFDFTTDLPLTRELLDKAVAKYCETGREKGVHISPENAVIVMIYPLDA